MSSLLTVDGQKVDRADVVSDMFQATASAIATATAEQWAQGLVWYSEAHLAAARIGTIVGIRDQNDAITLGADIIAILSPGTSWEHNVDVAESVALGLQLDDITYQGYTSMLVRAISYVADVGNGSTVASARAKYLRGPKVTAFAHCIEQPWQANLTPVIDRHMVKLAGFNKPKSLENKGVYQALADGVSLAAAFFGMLPAQAQAIAWLTVRPEPKVSDNLPTPY